MTVSPRLLSSQRVEEIKYNEWANKPLSKVSFPYSKSEHSEIRKNIVACQCHHMALQRSKISKREYVNVGCVTLMYRLIWKDITKLTQSIQSWLTNKYTHHSFVIQTSVVYWTISFIWEFLLIFKGFRFENLQLIVFYVSWISDKT